MSSIEADQLAALERRVAALELQQNQALARVCNHAWQQGTVVDEDGYRKMRCVNCGKEQLWKMTV